MRNLPQEDHADLGIVPNMDRTEDLRPIAERPPLNPVLPAPAEAVPTIKPTESRY